MQRYRIDLVDTRPWLRAFAIPNMAFTFTIVIEYSKQQILLSLCLVRFFWTIDVHLCLRIHTAPLRVPSSLFYFLRFFLFLSLFIQPPPAQSANGIIIMRQFETEIRVLATIYISCQLLLLPSLDGFPLSLTMHAARCRRQHRHRHRRRRRMKL